MKKNRNFDWWFATGKAQEMLSNQWQNAEKEHESEPVPDRDKLFASIQKEIERNEFAAQLKFIAMRAAMFVLPVILGTVLYYWLQTDAKVTEMVYITATVPTGEVQKIQLPDNSVVWLNAHSTIKYPKQFAAKHRTVELSGEAFFDVTHVQNQPFKVNCTNFSVEVLGTRFYISAYKNENTEKAILSRGSVRIKSNKGSYLLKPQSGYYFDKVSDTEKIVTADTVNTLLWTHGKRVFDNTPLEEILREFNRVYGSKHYLHPSLANKYRFSFTLTNESRNEMLKLLHAATGLNIRAVNDSIFILPNKK